jgi:hypothetical protein
MRRSSSSFCGMKSFVVQLSGSYAGARNGSGSNSSVLSRRGVKATGT